MTERAVQSVRFDIEERRSSSSVPPNEKVPVAPPKLGCAAEEEAWTVPDKDVGWVDPGPPRREPLVVFMLGWAEGGASAAAHVGCRT